MGNDNVRGFGLPQFYFASSNGLLAIAAGAISRFLAVCEGHPVGSKGRRIVNHHGRSLLEIVELHGDATVPKILTSLLVDAGNLCRKFAMAKLSDLTRIADAYHDRNGRYA